MQPNHIGRAAYFITNNDAVFRSAANVLRQSGELAPSSFMCVPRTRSILWSCSSDKGSKRPSSNNWWSSYDLAGEQGTEHPCFRQARFFARRFPRWPQIQLGRSIWPSCENDGCYRDAPQTRRITFAAHLAAYSILVPATFCRSVRANDAKLIERIARSYRSWNSPWRRSWTGYPSTSYGYPAVAQTAFLACRIRMVHLA